ncbi:hypothetical protein LOD99_306 [Oopsacas minuta]|uniref:Peroxisomal biogenesis factor 3 n=1 Tax=Oopsacas minuta TaxID=111878 RepID=A0AAV7K9U3_9METZ|nr:hypothetical protein LOD99_306 [Oopsacas minuta]
MPLSIIKKHPKKITALLLIGGLGFSSYLAFKYVKQQLIDMSQNMGKSNMVYTRKVQHFHSNQQTADNRIFGLTTALRDKLLEMADVDYLVNQLKEVDSTDKVALWENLKITSLSRVIAGTYLLCGLILLVRTKLNIIGGSMFLCEGETVSSNSEHVDRSQRERIQKQYIGYDKYLIEVGSVKLMAAVMPVVRGVLSRVSLRQAISFENFDEILIEIQNTLETGKRNNGDEEEFETISLQELFLPPENPDDNEELNYLFDSTRDILDQDFLHVLNNCIKVCFLYISRWTAAQCPEISSQSEELTVQFARLVISISKCFPVLFVADQEGLLHQLLTKREVLSFSQNIYEAFSSS